MQSFSKRNMALQKFFVPTSPPFLHAVREKIIVAPAEWRVQQ